MPILADSVQNSSAGYSKALAFAKSHYENFPVVSFLISKALKKHIAIIYWFARSADDIADEGDMEEKHRLEKLNEFEAKFNQALNGKPDSIYFSALMETVTTLNLTPAYFTNLLSAFKQDVVKKRYENFNELQNYCNNSANPVGRLILELFNVRNAEANYYSDKICTALQLTNFYQDTKIDFSKGRIYYPQDDMKKFGVKEKMFELNENNLNLQKLVHFNVGRARLLFEDGKNLLNLLSGMHKLEIKWTIKGGEAILNKISENNFDVLNERKSLNKFDFVKLFFASFFRL